jgi:hypothetical protein
MDFLSVDNFFFLHVQESNVRRSGLLKARLLVHFLPTHTYLAFWSKREEVGRGEANSLLVSSVCAGKQTETWWVSERLTENFLPVCLK